MRPVWAEPQADFSQIHLDYWHIVACDKPPVPQSFLPYDAMFVVLDERQKAAICWNNRAKTLSAHKTSTCNYYLNLQPDTKKSQLTSIELLNVVSNAGERGGCRTSMENRWVR